MTCVYIQMYRAPAGKRSTPNLLHRSHSARDLPWWSLSMNMAVNRRVCGTIQLVLCTESRRQFWDVEECAVTTASQWEKRIKSRENNASEPDLCRTWNLVPNNYRKSILIQLLSTILRWSRTHFTQLRALSSFRIHHHVWTVLLWHAATIDAGRRM